MSESGHFTSREILGDRFKRKLEVLYYVSVDSILPYKKALSWISKEPHTLNKGNSVKQMSNYLQEFVWAGLGSFSRDSFVINDYGRDYLKVEIAALSAWLKNPEDVKREFEKLKHK